MGFSQQEYWGGLPNPPPGDLPDPGIEPESSTLASGFFTTAPTDHWFSNVTLALKKKKIECFKQVWSAGRTLGRMRETFSKWIVVVYFLKSLNLDTCNG